jgi:hypothetical protein
VIDRNSPDSGVKVFAFGKKIHEQLVAFRKNKRTGGDFTHPITGFDIIIEKSGEGLKTKYNVMADRNVSQLAETEEEIDEILKIANDLDRYAQVPELSEIMTKLGLEDEESEEEPPARAVAPRGAIPAAARSAARPPRAPARPIRIRRRGGGGGDRERRGGRAVIGSGSPSARTLHWSCSL